MPNLRNTWLTHLWKLAECQLLKEKTQQMQIQSMARDCWNILIKHNPTTYSRIWWGGSLNIGWASSYMSLYWESHKQRHLCFSMIIAIHVCVCNDHCYIHVCVCVTWWCCWGVGGANYWQFSSSFTALLHWQPVSLWLSLLVVPSFFRLNVAYLAVNRSVMSERTLLRACTRSLDNLRVWHKAWVSMISGRCCRHP